MLLRKAWRFAAASERLRFSPLLFPRSGSPIHKQLLDALLDQLQQDIDVGVIRDRRSDI